MRCLKNEEKERERGKREGNPIVHSCVYYRSPRKYGLSHSY